MQLDEILIKGGVELIPSYGSGVMSATTARQRKKHDSLLAELEEKIKETGRIPTRYEVNCDEKMRSVREYDGVFHSGFEDAAKQVWLSLLSQRQKAEANGEKLDWQIDEVDWDVETWTEWLIIKGGGKMPERLKIKRQYLHEFIQMLLKAGTWVTLENAVRSRLRDGRPFKEEVRRRAEANSSEVSAEEFRASNYREIKDEKYAELTQTANGQRRWSDDELLQVLDDMQKVYGLPPDKIPTIGQIADYSKANATPSYSSFYCRFGSKKTWVNELASYKAAQQAKSESSK